MKSQRSFLETLMQRNTQTLTHTHTHTHTELLTDVNVWGLIWCFRLVVMEASGPSAAAPEFDVCGAMEWTDGVGTLPGSELKFRVNEFGVLEVITDEMDGRRAHATTTWTVPTAQEALPEGSVSKEESSWAQRGLVCVRCNRKGSVVDFLSDRLHCSERCQQQTQQEELKRETSGTNGEMSGRKRPRPAASEDVESSVEAAEEDDEDYEEKESRRPARGAARGRKKRRGDTALLRYTVPYGGKKKVWCWASYLEQERAIAAPTKLFKEYQALPQCKNGFRVGMRMEGIDPEHPSMYCVLSVAEVSGHRIRLHFDKYSECYDFWVNCNSPDIHPVGWCEKTGHKLHPPKGMKEEELSWSSYIKVNKIQTAPKALFQNQNMTVTPSGFRVGMKLEAIDKKNPSFICVATVTDMVDSRFLVHLDNWDETYDYWCDATSPYIHPIGWCQENNRTLTTPPGDPDVKNFSWEKYLSETGSLPAPARAFKSRPPHAFQLNMKLEAVDRRNPVLIRVATVVDTDDHRLRIHFDGWTEDYDYWMDADSPDIHPAGWCAKTGHPLQPPVSVQDMLEVCEQSGCPTPGCRGVGHIKGARYSGHHSAVGCPYSDINLNKDSVLPDRLSGEMPGTGAGRPRRTEPGPDVPDADSNEKALTCAPAHPDKPATAAMETAVKKPVGSETKRRVGRPCKVRKIEEPSHEDEVESVRSAVIETKEELSLQQALHQSVFMPCSGSSPSMPQCWDQHGKLLPSVAGITASKVSAWSVDEVMEFIRGLPGCMEQVRTFREEQIDGEAFLLLTQVDLVKILSIKLGPALKIYNSILMFKTTETSGCNEL
ncbi:lethal(3)malignant brain tumor-like protein 3 isoform X3 [Triplophysa dalaica]|uniref:lethal(3)malignant brain tumor-like protein 3 isoform X3 n=1 Tax=Triplophysa dalaica TaxID=1582913 RepID=UPI0024DF69C9|nr:lethal(3)malignant brain tumor-like protein 3 isoform X3 [Triplophysa dalaica]